MTKTASGVVSSQDLEEFLAAFNKIESLPSTTHKMPSGCSEARSGKGSAGGDGRQRAHLAPAAPLAVAKSPNSPESADAHEQDVPFEDLF